MTTDFASSLSGMGEAVVRSLANAVLDVGGAIQLQGVFRNPATLAGVGALGGMQSREPRFAFVTADACCTPIDRGTACAIGEQLFEVRLRTDRTEAGVTELDLQVQQ